MVQVACVARKFTLVRVRTTAGGGAIHRMSLRLDGWASIGPANPAAAASFVTTPLKFTGGSQLVLNAVVGDGGGVQVGIREVTQATAAAAAAATAAALPSNYTLAACVNVSGDLMYDIPVEWEGAGSNVSAFAGKTIELHFRLFQAELYGYKFL